ncbi:MAG: amino acid ABC transporter permease [Deltaproteobacteria bacterium]|nr:amino acid ABC transporter permease [Deltaproteobacteria bacterium]
MQNQKTKIKSLDILTAIIILAVIIYLIYRIKIGLHYKWDWGVIPQYLFRHDPKTHRWLPNMLMQGLFTTIRLSIWGTFLATLIGTVMGLCRVSRSLFYRLLGRTYVEIIRNIPPLVLIFIFYFFISSQIMPFVGLDRFVADCPKGIQMIFTFLFGPLPMFQAFLSATISLALFEGAYITEIIRAGIQSIEKGQWEASYALGLSRWRQMRHIVLPQAVQRALPPLAGQFISTVKDSAIVSVISIQELTFQGMELMSATYLTFEIWITITMMYFLITFILSLGVGHLETKMRKSMA